MALNRRSLKVSQRWGEGAKNHENVTRDNMLDAEDKFRALYKGMDKEQQRKINFQDGLDQSRQQAEKAKGMKFLSETDMMIKKGSDIPWTLAEFTRKIKHNINQGLVVIPNMMIGENVGGHSVHFQSREGLEFICGVGKNMDTIIKPETEFQDVNDGTKVERKIKSRGYLAAIDTTMKWLEKHQVAITRKNFLN